METEEKNLQVEKCNERKPAFFDSLKGTTIYLISQNDYVVIYYLVKILNWPKYYLVIVRSGSNQPFAVSPAKIVTDE